MKKIFRGNSGMCFGKILHVMEKGNLHTKQVLVSAVKIHALFVCVAYFIYIK